MINEDGHETNGYSSGLAMDVAELSRVAVRDRWGLALMAVGWVHLAIFLTCFGMFTRGNRTEIHYLILWAVELAAVVLIYRKTIGDRTRGPAPALLPLVLRVWITFLILSLNVASLNALTGLEIDWFRPVWGTLSTFGFAMMAWIFHFGFLIPAVQMSLTGLLLARFPELGYGIYAVSWWLALHGVGLTLEYKRVAVGSRASCTIETAKTVASPG